MTVDEDPYTTEFGELGYETSNIILNMGTVFIIVICNVIAFGLIYLLRILSRVCCKDQLMKQSKKLYDSLVWNGIIRLVLEGYLEFALSCFLGFVYFHRNTAGDIFSLIILFFSSFMLTVFPLIIIVQIVKNRSKMTEDKFQ